MAAGTAGSVSMGKVLGIAIVVSALVGGAVGYVTGGLTQPPATTVHPPQGPQTREFWVFTVVLPFNETATSPPHDYFAPDRMTVFVGDTVTVHFFNTEEAPENHTFTMEAPYQAENHELPYNATTTFTFTASAPGIFPFRCVYHQPTMTGWLVVLDA